MKNIHVLPTDKLSRVLYNSTLKSFCIQKEIDGMFINDGKVSGADFWGLEKALNNSFKPHNIYITSDEEIKEGDWVIQVNFEKTNTQLIQCATEFQVKIANDKDGSFTKKKIILTTDQDLIKDGVQAIDDEFLEWFVNNPSCEWVDVWLMNKGYNKQEDYPYQEHYLIIIPKEETKQETLEEFIQRQLSLGKYQDQESAIKYSILAGAKWQQDNSNINALNFEIDALKKQIELLKYQQERMYSEEEIIKILIEYDYSKINDDKLNSVGIVKKWFEQFKNK